MMTQTPGPPLINVPRARALRGKEGFVVIRCKYKCMYVNAGVGAQAKREGIGLVTLFAR